MYDLFGTTRVSQASERIPSFRRRFSKLSFEGLLGIRDLSNVLRRICSLGSDQFEPFEIDSIPSPSLPIRCVN